MKKIILLKSSIILIVFFFFIIGIITIIEIFENWTNYLVATQLLLIIWFIANIKLIENYFNRRFLEFEKIRSPIRKDYEKIEPVRDLEYYIIKQEERIKEQELGLKNIIKFIELHKDEIKDKTS
jgi:purine-cytosine permease-like protein